MSTDTNVNQLIVVRLTDANFPGNGGTVVAHIATMAEYRGMGLDRDGCRDAALRVWRGAFTVGAAVRMPGGAT